MLHSIWPKSELRFWKNTSIFALICSICETYRGTVDPSVIPLSVNVIQSDPCTLSAILCCLTYKKVEMVNRKILLHKAENISDSVLDRVNFHAKDERYMM